MDDKPKTQRERNANFSIDETNTLISIISENKEIIECKRTDAVTWRMKDRAWDNVTDSFNSCSATPRSKKSLKTKYEDIKKNIRRKSAHNKIERFKTGGGVPLLQKMSVSEETVAEMMGPTIDGEPSIWDSDTVPREQNASDIEHENTNSIGYENQEMEVQHDDLTPCDAFENIEFLEDYGDLEAPRESEIDVEPNIPKKGVRVLRKPTATALRRTIIKKRSREPRLGNDEANKKEEIHKMRMKILHQESKINEARLLAAQLDVEIKQIQKNIELTRLKQYQ